MSAPPPVLRKHYKQRAAVSAFYMGGPIDLGCDGASLASTCGSDVVLLSLVDPTAPFVPISCNDDTITAICFAPRCHEVVIASRSSFVRICASVDGSELRKFRVVGGVVQALAVDGLCSLVACGCADGFIRVYDYARNFATHALRGHDGPITALLFNSFALPVHGSTIPPHRSFWSGGVDGTVRLWNTVSKKCLISEEVHLAAVASLCLSSYGTQIVTASRDKTVKLLNARDLRTVTTIVAGVTMEGAALLQLDDLEYIVAVGDCTSIRIWDQSGCQLISCDTYDGEVVTKLLFKAGNTFTTVTQDHNFLRYKLGRSDLGSLELLSDGMQCGYHAEVTDVALISTSTVAVATNSNSVRVINFLSRESTLLRGHSDIVLCLCAMPKRDAIATSSKDSSIRLWNTITGETLTMLTGHVEAVTALCVCPSSNVLYSGSTDLTLKAWDLRRYFKAFDKGTTDAACRTLYTVKAHEKDINGIAISPNGILLATASQDKNVKMWTASDGKLLHTCGGHKRGVWCVAFSSVDRILASGSADSSIRIWNTDSGECIKSLQATSSVVRVSFISAGVQLLSYATWVHFLHSQLSNVTVQLLHLAYRMPNLFITMCINLETLLVSCGADGVWSVWTLRNNEIIYRDDAHADKIWGLAVIGDGSCIVTGSSDATVRIWDDVTVEVIAQQSTNAIHITLFQSRQEDERVEFEQLLSNAVYRKDWASAFQIAFKLNKPRALLNVVNQLFLSTEDDEGLSGISKAQETLRAILSKLQDEHLVKLFSFVCDWNTTSANSTAAQEVLLAIFSCKTAEDILKIKGIKRSAETLLLYSHRHYDRLSRLLQASFAVDLSLFKMSVVAPAHDISALLPNAIAQGLATNFLQKKTLSVQVRSRSNSPSQHDTETLPHVLPQTEITILSSEGAEPANRKRRRARA